MCIPESMLIQCQSVITKLQIDDICIETYKWIHDHCNQILQSKEKDFIEAVCMQYLIKKMTEGFLAGCKKADIEVSQIDQCINKL